MDGWKGRDLLEEEEWLSRCKGRAMRKAECIGGWVNGYGGGSGQREPGARGPGKFPQPVHFIVCSFMCPTTLWLS